MFLIQLLIPSRHYGLCFNGIMVVNENLLAWVNIFSGCYAPNESKSGVRNPIELGFGIGETVGKVEMLVLVNVDKIC